MPAPLSLPIPYGYTGLGALSQGQQTPVLPLAGQENPYYFPDPRNRPHTDIEIRQLYIPCAIFAAGNPSDYAPATAIVQLMLRTQSQLRWASAQQIPLIKDSSQPLYSSGSVLFAEDLVNPVLISQEEQPYFAVVASFDLPLTGGFFYLGAQIIDPQQAPSPQTTPVEGAAYYTIP